MVRCFALTEIVLLLSSSGRLCLWYVVLSVCRCGECLVVDRSSRAVAVVILLYVVGRFGVR